MCMRARAAVCLRFAVSQRKPHIALRALWPAGRATRHTHTPRRTDSGQTVPLMLLFLVRTLDTALTRALVRLHFPTGCRSWGGGSQRPFSSTWFWRGPHSPRSKIGGLWMLGR